MDKLLTIVIPTYNMEDLLEHCLNSLIIASNLMEQLEVLVIIDGATDCSSEIAHKYETIHPQTFRVIDKENGNYGSCINRGLQEAKGKYIKILDADDSFDNEALSTFIKSIKGTDYDLILTNYCFKNSYGHTTETKHFDIPFNTSLSSLMLPELGAHMAMHAVTYKTDNLRRIKYHQSEGISYTDQEWIFTPMTTVKTFTYIPICLYNYLIGREGQTMNFSNMSRNIHHNLTVMRTLIKTYTGTPNDSDIHEYLKNRIECLAEYIYTLYLYNMPKVDASQLADFDKELRDTCPPLHLYAATIRASRLPMVKMWRLLGYYTNDHGLHNFFRYRKYNPFK